jgi:phosphoglycolate phosphatase-like HAD superfamily hydrolase
MRVLVLDFDGTMTDAEREGEPFVRGYLDDLATLTGARDPQPRARLDAIAAMIDAAMLAAPAEHGYPWNGRLVAPASVDPYLRMVPVANAILDEFRAFEHPVDRARLHQILFRYNYDKTRARPCFKPGARELLAGLAGTETFVVTNSDTDAVRGKIEALDAGSGALTWLLDRVHGYAQKFEVDDAWSDGPADLALPGLARPVLARRRRYHDRLAGLLAQVGARWSDLTVVGDIFELDLAMPLAKGARVGLVANARTPAYERAYVESLQTRGKLIEHLRDIPAFAFAP